MKGKIRKINCLELLDACGNGRNGQLTFDELGKTSTQFER